MTNQDIKDLASKIKDNQYVPETYGRKEDGGMDFSKLIKNPLNYAECLKVAEHYFKLIKTMSKKDAFSGSIGFTIKPQTDISFQPRNHIANF